ncbi:23S rRNA (pseudouridine(1915)-N(3))-methyltransferase RlmH [uncultured Duncaniella sp.]|uniref:23S rRNA (pseudouridine(1915)-N(3))-methyltransferase RlmH n=2 Tax=uncultured Duncaniella sp. TaxID=2768039 RepID=UPI0025CE5E2A|nr:23S rRNA (pseudouridine(1915)-N(3))-methyltransferase RlmH [uncultured Duncaniella sp.]
MKIVIIAVGKTSTDYVARGVEEFLKRANRYVGVELTVIPDVKSSKALTEDAQKQQEGRAILAALQPGDVVTLLDERGKELTSREFSGLIERRMIQGIKRLVFVIGGPYGFAREVYERADDKLSLSRMTFTHEMVRLFFTEQIYRAMTIMRGEPYHHD